MGDHHCRMGILMTLVSKQTFKNIWLANGCVGGAIPVMGRGEATCCRTTYDRDDGEMTKSTVKLVKVIKWWWWV